jgi:hypothetical protein
MSRSKAFRPIQVLALCASCVVFSGCSVWISAYTTPYDEPTTEGVKSALVRYQKAILEGDEKAFCSMTDPVLLHKYAAGYQHFTATCPQVLDTFSSQSRKSSPAERGVFSKYKVNGDQASAVSTAEFEGRTIHTKLFLKRVGTQWVVFNDRELDHLGPAVPGAVYESYIRAVKRGDGDAACGLMTERGQGLLSEFGAERGVGVKSCETAVPVFAKQVTRIPPPEIRGGKAEGNQAVLFVLQPDGRGQFISRGIFMKKIHGRWLFDHSEDAGMSGVQPRSASQS